MPQVLNYHVVPFYFRECGFACFNQELGFALYLLQNPADWVFNSTEAHTIQTKNLAGKNVRVFSKQLTYHISVLGP